MSIIFPWQKIYYVYVHLDPRKPGTYTYDKWTFNYEPYYVGKGKGGRAWHYTDRNKHASNKARKILAEGLQPIVILKWRNKSETKALSLETRLISAIGRIDLGTGPLTNWDSSGVDKRIKRNTHHSKACSSGQQRRYSDPAEREKLSKATKDWVRNNPEKHLQACKARSRSLRKSETRARISKSVKDLNRKDPRIVVKQQASREATQRERNYYVQISRTLGGRSVEVNDNGKILIFDTQRQASSYIGCWPARVSSVLRRGGGPVTEKISIRALS